MTNGTATIEADQEASPPSGEQRAEAPGISGYVRLEAGGGSAPRPVEPQRISIARRGMVATAHWAASAAGAEMLAEGGNAIDAAVAAAFALGVCEPAASGLGGQTMMTIFEAETRRTTALDGSSRAPNRATPRRLKKGQRLRGLTASTVPSTPAVLGYALQRWGTLPLARVLEPAIRLAGEGYPISSLQRRLQIKALVPLRENSAGALFLEDGEPREVGTVFSQPLLAETFRRLAAGGIEEFYQGEIASQIHDDMERNGGLIRRDDLACIPWPIERKPVACRFEGLRVHTFPPPGAGRTLVEMLNILAHFPEKRRRPDSVKGAVLLSEIIRRAFLDRQDRPFDPNFYPQVQDRQMLSADYAKLAARQVRKRIKLPRGETTHLSVMDGLGNVVALTQSIERVFGSCAAHPELGFIYNNYMSAFEHRDITHPYFQRPNTVPWASVAPTIVFRGRTPWLAIGSPGSERITPTILQVLIRLGYQSPMEAVSAPRLHCSIDGRVSLEATRMRDDILPALERRGFTLDVRRPFSFYLGCVGLVVREGNDLIGVADIRRDGSAHGVK